MFRFAHGTCVLEPKLLRIISVLMMMMRGIISALLSIMIMLTRGIISALIIMTIMTRALFQLNNNNNGEELFPQI